MTYPGETEHAPEHGTAPAAAPAASQPDFTPQELESLHQSDRMAASAVVGLLTCIFSTGVVLYLLVLWSVV